MLESYSEGFLTKCAEYDIPFETALEMLKVAHANNGGIEKDAWDAYSTYAASSVNPYLGLYAGGSRTAPIAGTSDNYVRSQLNQRNANLMPYLDKVDSGRAGTMLGRAWHGLNDNAIGRMFGIRGSREYIRDKEVERLRGASALANKDVEAQKAYNDAINGGPQLDQLQVSSLGGYVPRKSQTTAAVPTMKTTFGNGRRGGQGGYQRPGGGYQRPGGYRSPYQYRPRMAGGNEYA